jgi:hypothetical protein
LTQQKTMIFALTKGLGEGVGAGSGRARAYGEENAAIIKR